MQLSIVLSYYKAIQNLKLILKALNNQSNMHFELILSEDDSNEETKQFIEQHKNQFAFPITHLWQEQDNGFRKNEMLNTSILNSKTKKIVFIDGDCVPHKHFVKSYIAAIKPGFIFEGRAVMLDKKTTETIKKKQSLRQLSLSSLLFTKTQKIKDAIYFPYFPLSLRQKGRGLVGRNWAIYKKHLEEINGFDMDYIFAGVGEDVDIEWRLKSLGIKTKSMKNKAIVYHLFHPKVYSEDKVKENFELLKSKQARNKIVCEKGLMQLA